MRSVPLLLLALSLFGCTTERVSEPREYLDERTAATITVVRDPWIFSREAVRTASGQARDFLQLYAIDVNRMGEHNQYLAALHSLPASSAADASVPPTLKLEASEWSLRLEATTAQPRDIGLARPVADTYALDATWSYFPVDKQTLASIANASDLEVEILWEGERTAYVLWRDGRAELSELTAVLP